jgi:hypothetical protein
MLDSRVLQGERRTAAAPLDWLPVVFMVCSAFLCAHGVGLALQHALISFPEGVVADTVPQGGYMEFELVENSKGIFPSNVLAWGGDGRKVLSPGDRVSKDRWSLTFVLDGEELGGVAWYLQYIVGWRVVIPFVGGAFLGTLRYWWTGRLLSTLCKYSGDGDRFLNVPQVFLRLLIVWIIAFGGSAIMILSVIACLNIIP